MAVKANLLDSKDIVGSPQVILVYLILEFFITNKAGELQYTIIYQIGGMSTSVLVLP